MTPSVSRANSGSQSEPHSTLTTFQPAPAYNPSSSWTIEPLPRTGPSSRCRLQLTTKTRLSRPSRAARKVWCFVGDGEMDEPESIAVAHEAPHLARGRLQKAAIGEVAHEARLVDRVQRTEPHRTRRELPETRHQPWVTVGRQSLACGFTPVIRQIFLGKPPFQKSARIDARRGMRLEVHRITVRASAEKMVVAHFEQVRGGSIGRQVPAKFRVLAIGAYHHGERVPAHQRAEPGFNLKIAGELGLIGKRDGVAIRRTEKGRQRNAPRTA